MGKREWTEDDVFAFYLQDEYSFYSSVSPKNLDRVPVKVLFDDYVRWCKRNKRPCNLNEHSFRQKFIRQTPYLIKTIKVKGEDLALAIHENNQFISQRPNVETNRIMRQEMRRNPEQFLRLELETISESLRVLKKRLNELDIDSLTELLPFAEQIIKLCSIAEQHMDWLGEHIIGSEYE